MSVSNQIANNPNVSLLGAILGKDFSSFTFPVAGGTGTGGTVTMGNLRLYQWQYAATGSTTTNLPIPLAPNRNYILTVNVGVLGPSGASSVAGTILIQSVSVTAAGVIAIGSPSFPYNSSNISGYSITLSGTSQTSTTPATVSIAIVAGVPATYNVSSYIQ
jgi:hypothetical protein